MTAPTPQPPSATADPADPSVLRLSGHWTIGQAHEIGKVLRAAPGDARCVDATAVQRLDSLGVLQLLLSLIHI